MTTWRVALAIMAKDLRIEFTNRTALTAAATFGTLVLVIFDMARDPYDKALQQSTGPSA